MAKICGKTTVDGTVNLNIMTLLHEVKIYQIVLGRDKRSILFPLKIILHPYLISHGQTLTDVKDTLSLVV